MEGKHGENSIHIFIRNDCIRNFTHFYLGVLSNICRLRRCGDNYWYWISIAICSNFCGDIPLWRSIKDEYYKR